MQLKRILCKYHRERTPSMVVYPDGSAHCFGCGAHIHSGDDTITSEDLEGALEPYVENLEESLAYIKTLPVKAIRGLQLPYDDDFYYIVWPNAPYYKKRYWNPPKPSDKYRCPAGHPKPMFVAAERGQHLFIVEGEVNALSIASITTQHRGVAIVSPGSATDFYSPKNDKYLPIYADYASIRLIVDNDSPGTIAAIELKSRLIPLNPNVSVQLMSKDANEILATEGPDALHKTLYG